MVEKRKKDILESLEQLSVITGHLRRATENDLVPVEGLALNVMILQLDIIKEQYEALKAARTAYRGNNGNGTG